MPTASSDAGLTAPVSHAAIELQTGHAPVGVFDSGLGGLSVLRALRAQVPDESILDKLSTIPDG